MAQRKSVLLRAAEQRSGGRSHGVDASAFDPAYLASQLPIYGAVFGPGRYFDTRIQGLERVPADPAMIVSNHSGGTTILDGFGFLIEWYRHFGAGRPVHGLAHEILFAPQGLGRYLERCGMLRARRDLARDVVHHHGHDLIVMPGGDLDVWRPASQRYQVRFSGRKGYARTAIELGVPIVPMAHVGAHHTLHVITDGRSLARRIKLIRELARAEIWPVHISLPWGIAIGPLPHLPPPAVLDYRLAEPIRPPEGPVTDEKIADLDAQVRTRIQLMLDEVREERQGRSRTVRGAARRLRQSVTSLRDLVREVRELDVTPAAAK